MDDVIINTWLRFKHNRMKLMKMEDLIKTDHFQLEDKMFKEAQQTLYDFVQEIHRPSNREWLIHRKDGPKDKAEADLKNIYDFLQAIHPCNNFTPPKFAAILSNFSPIDVCDIDAAALYTDIITLEKC